MSFLAIYLSISLPTTTFVNFLQNLSISLIRSCKYRNVETHQIKTGHLNYRQDQSHQMHDKKASLTFILFTHGMVSGKCLIGTKVSSLKNCQGNSWWCVTYIISQNSPSSRLFNWKVMLGISIELCDQLREGTSNLEPLLRVCIIIYIGNCLMRITKLLHYGKKYYM